jgi:membrane-associated phospholipid phosphatase
MAAAGRISAGEKLLLAAGASAVNAALYLVPNHLPLKEPVLLPWTALDAAVPFVPLTLWIYVSDYVLVATAFLLVRTWAEAKQFARAYLALLVIGAAVHLMWPTTFPREAFPLVGDGVTERVFALLRQVDLPTSCLPSMHVAGSYLAAFSLWRHGRGVFVLYTSWATAVAVSTLTAKQHYAVDVVAGFALAAALWAVFFAVRAHRGSTSLPDFGGARGT